MDFAVHIHQAGPHQGLPIYEPNLMSIREGGRATLVAHLVVWDEKGEHLCKGHLTKQFFKLQANLPEGTGCITLINAKVLQIRGPVLVVDDNAKTLVHKPSTMQSLERMSETCGGLGALGVGAEHAGFKITVVNDVQPSFCQKLQQQGRCEVVTGDICKMTTVIELHEKGDGAAVFAFGFNCQPFSSLGDNRQGMDERSATLTYGLYAAYLLQMKIVIMECVPNALQSKFVKVGIQHYINHTDAFRSDEVLELSDLWPSYRRRWWCVLTHPAIGKIALQPLPKLMQIPTMSDLMPKFMEITQEEMEQLLLTDHEQSTFLSLSGGSHHTVLDIHSTLATALHSWGNQCIKCRCGCGREFSFHRLKNEGIHGALIFVHNSFPGQSLRHMSAREMSIFTGFPSQQDWTGDQRMLTAGVGQLASPIQSSWICGMIRQHLKTMKFLPSDDFTPKSSVASVCFATMDLQQQWMGNNATIEMDLFRESIKELLTDLKIPNSIATSFQASAKSSFQSAESAARVEPVAEIHQASAKSSFPSADSAARDEPVAEIHQETEEDNKKNSPIKSPIESIPVEPASPDGFSQAVAASIVKIENLLGDPSKVVDVKTGGILAFASRETPSLKRTREEVSTVAEVPCEASVSPKSQPVVMQSSLYQQIIPEDLIAERTIIYDVATQQAWAIQVSSGQTIADMIRAHKELHGEQIKFHDVLGNECAEDQVVVNQVYLMNFAGHKLEPNLRERAFSLLFKPRWQSLLIQGSAVALDEMNQYLGMIAEEKGCKHIFPVVVHTVNDCDHVANHWDEAFANHEGPFITAVCHQNHWIPFMFEKLADHMQVSTDPDGKKLWPLMGVQTFCDVQDRIASTPQFQNDCGFQCFAWLMTCISGQPLVSMPVGDAIKLRNHVWHKWYSNGYQSVVPTQIVLGGQSEVEVALCAILKEHGVFMERVQERSRLILQKLGQQAVVGAMKSVRPWQSLKQMANMQTPPVRLIQDDEFQAVLKDRTKDGQPVKTQKKSVNVKKPRHDPVVFTPKDIHIPDGVFAQADGEILGHIGVRQVHPQARGVVLVQEGEWSPFRGQKTISSEGLGFLIMAPYSQEVMQLGQEIRFPAQSTNTGEPVLLSAVLIQHGSKEVGRCQPSNPQSIEQIDTQTIKVLLYRDQCQMEWKEVVPKPVKAVLSLVECLQTCNIPACQCNKSHKESNDVDPIIDLWQRDFVSLHFQKTKPDQAAIFTCFMRVAKDKMPILLSQSGQEGIYIEPRQQDGRKMDDSYHTVWLNKQTFAEARALQATTKVPVSLVRVTNRYGLRVESRFGQDVHSNLKPDSPFISNGEKINFVVGPLPFGTTKKAMMKLFEQWGWVAQPIHPCGRSQDQKGLMWKIVAGSPPEHLVYTLAHGDVMVTRETVPTTKEAVIPRVEASKHTKSTMSQGIEALREDPWAEAASKLPTASGRVQEMTPAQVASVEARIESNLLAKMSPPSDITMDPHEPRLASLEAQVLELQKSQQMCVDQQGQVNRKIDTLQHQVECQATTFQACLENQMSEQMKRIESLLNKRKATE